MANDPIVLKALALTFPYVDDMAAQRDLERRLAAAARAEQIVYYSDLVKGVSFQIPSVHGGKSFELGVPEWTDLHRTILGAYLGKISCDSYADGGFFASAVAVSKATSEPSDGFRELLVTLGLVGSKKSQDCTTIWLDHLQRAYRWVQENPSWPDAGMTGARRP